MPGSPRLQAFLDSLKGLSGRQWAAILCLLICANLIVYGALGWLFYRYVLSPPPVVELESTPAPTLRPTFTPTWTPPPTRINLPTFQPSSVPIFLKEPQLARLDLDPQALDRVAHLVA